MTLAERLADANQRSVTLYLRRQQIELRRQELVTAGQQCDFGLVKIDGEIEVLTALIAEEKAPV